uniref:Dolichol phosphate-mannose biosynthesis regulatory protein n=1 Tax=Ciona intestinalis TaxID=7719 RepID=H2XKQ1_CIOIN
MGEILFPKYKVFFNICAIIILFLYVALTLWVIGLPLIPNEMEELKKIFYDPIFASIVWVACVFTSVISFGILAICLMKNNKKQI